MPTGKPSNRAAAWMRQRIDYSMSAPVMISLRIKRPKPRSTTGFRPRPPAPAAVREHGARVIGYQRGGRGLRDRARARLSLAPPAMTRRPRVPRTPGRRYVAPVKSPST
ncbi:hypothetical protein [Mycobacterium arosiense]|uniref:hypothetical protein n=1 Tax=Mycobacterium arosiense TaxID=425468 RepID=UPI001150CEC6|nr:hypothetical protein [Mycobacterium arosiense]